MADIPEARGLERNVARQDETPKAVRDSLLAVQGDVKANQARVEDELCDVVLYFLFVSVAVAAATTNTPHLSLSQN